MSQAINEALRQEMQRDSTVILMGEDIAGGAGVDAPEAFDAWGGILGVTKGLIKEFGKDRVLDTPISESAFVGAAIGAAACGLRPVVEIMSMDFIGVCFDQILNQAAKIRYMSGGSISIPMVIRTAHGAGFTIAAQHSQVLYSLLVAIPGLKVVVPSTPYDAKGLLISAIRDNDPVIFCENKTMYFDSGDVPEEPYTVPFGRAEIRRQGEDVTIVAIAAMVPLALQAAEQLAKEDIQAEVIDPRTLYPLDEDTILHSVDVTGRLVVVDESNPHCSMASEIAAIVCEKSFDRLDAPVQRVNPPHTPVPFSPPLEAEYVPRVAQIVRAAHATM
jgi:pyruvate/2-oxoglutarate/acetoin dehydrogenase E1 component